MTGPRVGSLYGIGLALLPVTLLGVSLGGGALGADERPRRLTHGVASGDVTSTSAVLWARSDGPAEIVFEVATGAGARTLRGTTEPTEDWTVHLLMTGLKPGTPYNYRARINGAAESEAGSFRTAPAAHAAEAIRFVFGGDVGGQGYCREAALGYRIFASMAAAEPDFLIANGDMIYADNTCPADGPGGPYVPGDFHAVSDPTIDWTSPLAREVIFAHWRYNRADPSVQGFLRQVPVYAQWDDHEVINDFGASWPSWPKAPHRPGYPRLVQAGRDAFFAYSPIARSTEERDRVYRAFPWGRGFDLFLLDARSYRQPNDLPDDGESPKTLLGREQLAWLERSLLESKATWKIISSDVPISVPTGSDPHLYGHDGWADGTAEDFSSRTGFERELAQLLHFLDAHNVRNVVFVATDVHLAMSLRYKLDADGDGDTLLFHEFLSGPLHAGRTPAIPPLDPTFQPAVLYAEANLYNFGLVRITPGDDGIFRLSADIRDETGAVRFGSLVELEPEEGVAGDRPQH